ncbi:MAG: hypothetical protein IPL65_16925 [Lewinellaceae bacterium]|nr:hypothetical protein [Lewinellaceae bacterium]
MLQVCFTEGVGQRTFWELLQEVLKGQAFWSGSWIAVATVVVVACLGCDCQENKRGEEDYFFIGACIDRKIKIYYNLPVTKTMPMRLNSSTLNWVFFNKKPLRIFTFLKACILVL